MLSSISEKLPGIIDCPVLANASLAASFIIDRAGNLKQANYSSNFGNSLNTDLLTSLPKVRSYLEKGNSRGAFFNISELKALNADSGLPNTLYMGPLPGGDNYICLLYDVNAPICDVGDSKSEMVILSLISQAVRAFNRAENLETILRIVLIGVTAGCGLGFNRAYILLTCDEHNCLRGALANGPSSPEEANMIWTKLSNGEITLKKMFDDALQNKPVENPPLNGYLKNIEIPLDDKDNIFVRAALEKKSMIVDQAILSSKIYSSLYAIIGPGPIAVVPLTVRDYLQGVLIADNFITRKEITEGDLRLLEIFARYASDSIKNFRLYERLEKKIQALKRANEMIISSRENMIKAERLSVLAEMAGEVAHEIRNPLTIIGGFAKSLLKKANPGDANLEYLKIIFEQVERISQALEKFTSLTNYESTSDRVCNLGEIVRSAVAVRVPGLNFSQVEVHGDEQIFVKTDPDLLRQVFIIVLKQASAINFDNIPVEVSLCRRADKVVVFLGTRSLSGEFAKQLYKSFYSGGNYDLLKQLSTTLEILKYYRGNIGMESSNDEAKKFYIELPVYEEDG